MLKFHLRPRETSAITALKSEIAVHEKLLCVRAPILVQLREKYMVWIIHVHQEHGCSVSPIWWESKKCQSPWLQSMRPHSLSKISSMIYHRIWSFCNLRLCSGYCINLYGLVVCYVQQNSTEWKRKPTAISHPATANGSGVQMAKPLRQHQHRNHHRNKRVEGTYCTLFGCQAWKTCQLTPSPSTLPHCRPRLLTGQFRFVSYQPVSLSRTGRPSPTGTGILMAVITTMQPNIRPPAKNYLLGHPGPSKLHRRSIYLAFTICNSISLDTKCLHLSWTNRCRVRSGVKVHLVL